MKAQRSYAVLMLLVAMTLVSISHAQTERPRTGSEAINSQDANPTPSNSGAHSAPGTLPNSANNPGQAVPGKAISPMSPAQRTTPAIPAAADQNPPVLTAPIQPQAEVLQNAFYEFLFNNISDFDQIADSKDKAGKHAEAALWRTHDQKGAGLNDAEGQILDETALACLRALKEQDAKIQAAVDKDRAQRAPGVRGPTPVELIQLIEERKKIVSDHIEKLREALGNSSFTKVDTYIHASFHADVVVPKQAIPSTKHP